MVENFVRCDGVRQREPRRVGVHFEKHHIVRLGIDYDLGAVCAMLICHQLEALVFVNLDHRVHRKLVGRVNVVVKKHGVFLVLKFVGVNGDLVESVPGHVSFVGTELFQIVMREVLPQQVLGLIVNLLVGWNNFHVEIGIGVGSDVEFPDPRFPVSLNQDNILSSLKIILHENVPLGAEDGVDKIEPVLSDFPNGYPNVGEAVVLIRVDASRVQLIDRYCYARVPRVGETHNRLVCAVLLNVNRVA